jgi:hypothetical protein
MNPLMLKASARPEIKALALVLLAIAITFARRPDQFFRPYLFVEEGTILRAYLGRGIGSFLDTIGGYYNLVPKLIWFTALEIDIAAAPAIAAWLATLFAAAVVVAIALSPTHLCWRTLCAIATLIVPTTPEFFAVALHSYFWAGLLIFLALLWDPSRGKSALRVVYIVVGGLSSPLIFPAAVLFAIRAAIERTRTEYVAFGAAAAMACIQTLPRLLGRNFGPFNEQLLAIDLVAVTNSFVGAFLLGPRYSGYLPSGLLTIAVLSLLIWNAREKLPALFYLLLAAWAATIAAAVMRWDPVYTHPFQSNDRYLFTPYVLFAWSIVWLANVYRGLTKAVLVASLFAASLIMLPRLSQRDHSPDWRQELATCANSEGHVFRINHFDGRNDRGWVVTLTGDQCRRALGR